MNEVDFFNILRNKWVSVHWVRIENSSLSGTPDANFCFDGYDVWVELKILRGNYVYLKKFQQVFHLSRNRKGGHSFIFARDKERIMVLAFTDPEVLKKGIAVGDFRKYNVQDLELVIQWEKPFNWAEMFYQLMERVKCRK